MKTQYFIPFFGKIVTMSLLSYLFVSVEYVNATGSGEPHVTAEYKCTSKCSMCVTFDGKKTVCSERYTDDSEDFLKAKKLSRFVNEGLIKPPVGLKNSFNIDAFARQFYKCDLMVKKVEMIQEATKNLCEQKTVKYQKTMLVPRTPAQVKVKKK